MDNNEVLIQRKCERCGHVWVARVMLSRTCPKCKSPYWDVPRKQKDEVEQKG